MGNHRTVGHLTKQVIETFSLNLTEGQPILCGESNIEHMKQQHPEDFELYGDKIEDIINKPDFIAKHPKKRNSSIEYIKIFEKENNDYVLVAVRATGRGTLFARTLFVMDNEKVDKYRRKDAFKDYK